MTPWTLAHQALLSMGFPRQEEWSGLLFPSPGESSQPSDENYVSYVSCVGWQVLGQLNFLKVVAIPLGSLPGSSVVKNLPVKVGDTGASPGLGISPGVGNGNPLHYSCLGNPMDRGEWRATTHGVAKSWIRPGD